ncbi:ArsR/SmtB family transcription factor [Amycolatopsis jiangsuensis]|uniref:DNA-binding transcriptional ArsR family regulator n=1 Tax=Amycolatopsis jiangsuensis TaxID=1181879 RepID=A0A840J4Y0_9PSEU|nr:winged helix-turn-helix domain-containing protein [Amycolatopsis jiangsuensis]MBB4688414.1 DNA-binding transcriptional ArsR family regulator [Amycolatopsis jiangsuensis]
MPLTVALGVGELAQTRFAVSPLSETVAALLQLNGRNPNVLHLRWLRWAAGQLSQGELPLTSALLAAERPSWPNFLVPAPVGPAASLDDDLAALRRTSARQVRASLRRVFGDELPAAARPLAEKPAAGLKTVAGELRVAYERVVEPQWQRIRALLDADVGYRARRLAAGGAARLFADLHPDLRWEPGRLVRAGGPARRARLGPGGLVLMPVALGSPDVFVRAHTATQTTIRYPARGIGALWTASTRPSGDWVARLLGPARAELLAALRSPATTSDLAAALDVTPSAVSQHLRVLRETGLVARERTGRSVLYFATDLGAALLAGPAVT